MLFSLMATNTQVIVSCHFSSWFSLSLYLADNNTTRFIILSSNLVETNFKIQKKEIVIDGVNIETNNAPPANSNGTLK